MKNFLIKKIISNQFKNYSSISTCLVNTPIPPILYNGSVKFVSPYEFETSIISKFSFFKFNSGIYINFYIISLV